MIDPAFFEYIYDAATMQRWNDHIRPHKGFTELDKQSHKMVYAFILAHIEESKNKTVIDWQKLIEGGLFELLQRITLTDIKPPIFHQLMSKKGNELNEWFINKLECTGFFEIEGNFREKIRDYFFDPGYCPTERRILSASHYLATNWEFAIVYRFSRGSFGLEETKKNIESELEEYFDLDSVKKLQKNTKLSGFLDLIGQLRFQQRWAQTPRIPETSVLGHMLIVAIMAYLTSLQLGACKKRLYNNYFAGLFHDLPEVLTRDIISPVKRSVDELEEIIKEIEEMQVSEKILPLLPKSLHDEIKYYTLDEFNSKVRIDGKVTAVNDEDINTKYNSEGFDPLDGHLLKGCDKLAAFLEAYLSIKFGIDTSFLREGCESIYAEYKEKIISGFDFGELFRSFRPEDVL